MGDSVSSIMAKVGLEVEAGIGRDIGGKVMGRKDTGCNAGKGTGRNVAGGRGTGSKVAGGKVTGSLVGDSEIGDLVGDSETGCLVGDSETGGLVGIADTGFGVGGEVGTGVGQSLCHTAVSSQ